MEYLAGTRLGPYEILAPIGAGGMGQVLRARDARLGRDVAIKVLPTAFASDAERLRRFEQEARAAGVLNHPNILVIFDIGTEDGAPYVVSELLEGETLRDRMVKGSIPLSKVVDWSLQTAKGLAAAHAKNIVHRDLKPENLFVTRDNVVKILDFGLAKLILAEMSSESFTQAPTAVLQTEAGQVMGTSGYMSPEQLRGQPVDFRSDIFSFGIVLYEMLAGERPFQRDTAADTTSAILREDPRELHLLERAVPPGLERIVMHCLEKQVEDRFQSTRDVAFALEALSGTREAALDEIVSTTTKRKSAKASKSQKLAVAPIPTFRQLTFRRGTIFSARLAATGTTIVYSAAWDGEPVDIYSTRSGFPESRSLGFKNAHLLSLSSSGELAVLLDSRYVSHRQFNGTLARVPLEGAAPRALLEDVREAEWSPDGKNLLVVRGAEGHTRLEYPAGTVLYETPGWISHPRLSNKGNQIAFLDHWMLGDDRGSVALLDLAGNRKTLSDGWAGEQGLAWSATGQEVWFTAAEAGFARALHAVSMAGRSRLVTRQAGGLILKDIAPDGRVLVIRDIERSEIMGRFGDETKERNLSWLDLSIAVDLSEDGSTLLFMEQGVAVGSTYAACLRRTDGSPAMRLGEGAAHSLSPDGRWALAILYGAEPELILLPTGAGEARSISREGIVEYHSARWTPDGEHIVFVGRKEGERAHGYVQALAGGPPRSFTSDEVEMRGVPVSPDGRYVALTRIDRKTLLYPLDGGDPRPVTGMRPGEVLIRWSGDGRSLFVYAPGTLPANVVRVNLETAGREPWMELIPSDPAGVGSIGQIRLTPDGRSCVYSFKRTLSELYLVEGQT